MLNPSEEKGVNPRLFSACKSSTGATEVILYSASCAADRPATDYTARIVPMHVEATVPLELGQVLWQR